MSADRKLSGVEEARMNLGDRSLTEAINTSLHITPEEAEPEPKPPLERYGIAFAKFIAVLACLYIFLTGLSLMGTAFKVLGGRSSAEMFSFASNPIAGLMIGIFATVLVQSSSTTTSIVVGLVGAGSMSVRTAVPVIMGANIGTSVTNTIVSLVHAKDPAEFARAFAGATVHDFFNILVVITLLPIEVITNFLERLTGEITKGMKNADGAKFTSPTKIIISPFAKLFLGHDKKLIKKISKCDGYEEGSEQWNDGGCDDLSGPIAKGGFLGDLSDGLAGTLALIISLIFLCGALILLVKILNSVMKGSAAKFIKRALNMHGALAMLAGALITVAVQSSSVTTSTLVPLVGVGAVRLEKMFPLTLGANVGTTVTALLAAISTGEADGLQIALCHLFFNLVGILIWYPIPVMRAIPLWFARTLGEAVSKKRMYAVVYTLTVFFLIPGVFLGLSIAGSAVVLGFGIPILLFFICAAVYIYIRGEKPHLIPAWFPEKLQPSPQEDKPQAEMAAIDDNTKYDSNTPNENEDVEVRVQV